jgi:hypothetical protein
MKIDAKTAALANLNHWKAGQGARIRENRPPEVYSACEHVARQWAPVRDPLILDADELGNAVKAAICGERCKLHPGPVEKISADDFWDQINSIAERWGIKTTRDQWESTTKKPDQKAAA